MKTEWRCTWQYIPGGTEQTAAFKTESAARQAMAKVLREGVDLGVYIDLLRRDAGGDCGSAAAFLERFLRDLTIPTCEAEVPPHLDIPDRWLLEMHPTDGFRWGLRQGQRPLLVVSRAAYVDDSEPLIVDFGFEAPEHIGPDRVNAVYIRIEPRVVYGSSAYPLMVLAVLEQNVPKTQERLIRDIAGRYGVHVDRKAVGRHLQLLQALGYPVKRVKGGYCLE